MTAPSAIPNQVRLPLRVALGVVSQGIRIRFGRSVVTITGVVFGIAFLMSILTGQSLRRGVAAEESVRAEAGRMLSFLTAETGPPAGRIVAVLAAGPLAPHEERLFLELERGKLAGLRWHSPAGGPCPLPFRALPVEQPTLANLADGASALVVAGGRPPDGVPWARLLARARQPVVAFTRAGHPPIPAPFRSVDLSARPTPEQEARAAAGAAREKFRSLWIVAISLLVTVIGISNAMLMSVTERFREIGTMKCLGALSAFVRQIFLIESAFMGTVGGLAGAVAGALFSIGVYSLTYGGLVGAALAQAWPALLAQAAAAVASGVALSVLAALYPAHVASSMIPANALRSNV